ncbi:MAG TPA: hypothetical protein VML75_08685, partial [Kofleriaceae bacterium]|nr:hypothetical protein [Kofleriaceae bacterium]
ALANSLKNRPDSSRAPSHRDPGAWHPCVRSDVGDAAEPRPRRGKAALGPRGGARAAGGGGGERGSIARAVQLGQQSLADETGELAGMPPFVLENGVAYLLGGDSLGRPILPRFW